MRRFEIVLNLLKKINPYHTPILFASIVCCFFCFFMPSHSYSQADSAYVLTFNFNEHQIKEANNKLRIKPEGISLTDDRFGNKQSAIYLHGHAASYLNLGTSTLLKPKIGTISMWVNIDRRVYTGTGYEVNPIIETKNDTGDDFIIAYTIVYDCHNKRYVACSTKDSTKEAFICSNDEVAFNKWCHLAITYDNNYFAFYINGELQQKYAKGFETKFLKSDSVVIGNTASKKNDRWTQGTIDDIQIFHKVLTGNEIKALYEAPNPNRFAIIRDNVIKYVLIGLSILFVSYILVTTYRRRLKREEEKYNLKSKLYEMEIKMIKAQMNPHFIFNSINSIQQFISLHENDKAEFYLSNFSRLLRKLLENSTKDNLSLTDEIDVLSRYLEMEVLRFSNVFKYTIVVDKKIDAETTFIPHFLIQPFVENAIWHGLLPKQGDKILSINFELINEKKIVCIIEDNGVGRNFKKEAKKFGKDKSLAINFIQQRLDLMNKNLDLDLSLTITDKVDKDGIGTGTKVVIYLPIMKNIADINI
jgi:hypothetical protein